jgi:hypothetical protein
MVTDGVTWMVSSMRCAGFEYHMRVVVSKTLCLAELLLCFCGWLGPGLGVWSKGSALLLLQCCVWLTLCCCCRGSASDFLDRAESLAE